MKTAFVMKPAFAAFALAATVAGCEGRRSGEEDADITKRAADTVVTQRQVQDTTVVVTDTTIKADTTVKKDTLRKSANVRPADTVTKSP